jgi:hypothetical protein
MLKAIVAPPASMQDSCGYVRGLAGTVVVDADLSKNRNLFCRGRLLMVLLVMFFERIQAKVVG